MPSTVIRSLFVCSTLLASADLAAARQSPHADHLAQIPRASSPEAMERAISLTPGAGTMSQPVSTKSTEAQAYYNQGIAYLHSYVWVDAARSFHEALRRDPNLAMAYLGLAKAYTGAEAYAGAMQHMDRAAALAAKGQVTPKEAKWVALGQQQMKAMFAADAAEHKTLHDAYKAGIDELIAMDPDDAHAWVLRGNAEESRATGRGQGGGVGSIAYYQTALAHDPKHWGADHYLIHSYENVGQYRHAADHGKKYADAATSVPHAQHMYAHVLPRLGRWKDALEYLVRADKAQRAYFASGIDPSDEWHHGHNLHLQGIVQFRLGDVAAAERLFREAFDQRVRSLRDGRFVDPLLELLLVQGRFDDALKAAEEARRRDLTSARFIGTVRGAEALIALGRADQARAWQQEAAKLLEQLKGEVKVHPLYQRLPDNYRDSHLEPLGWELGLTTPEADAAAERLLNHAKGFVNRKSFDGWVTGLIRLEQLSKLADRAGRRELADAMIAVMRQIDPEYAGKVSRPSPSGGGGVK